MLVQIEELVSIRLHRELHRVHLQRLRSSGGRNY
jgi:hypothetical protein